MLRQELLGIERRVGTAYRGIHDQPSSNHDFLQSWILFSACIVDICLTVGDQTCLNGQLYMNFYAVLLLAATSSTTGDTNPGQAEYCVSSFFCKVCHTIGQSKVMI